MTEAEILSNAIQAAQATAAIFSLFLTIVSAYIAALYFFLNRRRACGRWLSLCSASRSWHSALSR